MADTKRWSDLEAVPGIVAALDHAGPKDDCTTQNAKRHWSERFANGCAIAVANELRRTSLAKGKRILPESLACFIHE